MFLWAILLLNLYHRATDAVSLIFLFHWIGLLQSFLRRRTPNQLVSLAPLCKKPHRQASLPFAYPATYVLISSYMLRMTFVSLLLGLARLKGFILVANPLMEQTTTAVLPPEPAPDPHDFLPKRTRRAPAKRLLHLGLMAAIAVSDAIPTLNLKSKQDLKRTLRKHRGASGFITKTSSIQPPALSRLRTVLEASQCHLLSKDDHFEVIIDSGCSKSVSPCVADFVPGSLVNLPSPLAMDGIAGQLIAHQTGLLRYEILNDAGGITILECQGYHLPDLKICLFSPQVFLAEQKGGWYVLNGTNPILNLLTVIRSLSNTIDKRLFPSFAGFIMSWERLRLSPSKASLTNPPPRILPRSNSGCFFGTPSGAISDGSTLSGSAVAES
jgi:hypothetical protein